MMCFAERYNVVVVSCFGKAVYMVDLMVWACAAWICAFTFIFFYCLTFFFSGNVVGGLFGRDDLVSLLGLLTWQLLLEEKFAN